MLSTQGDTPVDLYKFSEQLLYPKILIYNVSHFGGADSNWPKVIGSCRNLHRLSKKPCHPIDPGKTQPYMLSQIKATKMANRDQS